tara:strand:+ start:639 stop:830 length:192 start_codon:yes stop_codon:yes gene_type:complete
MKESERASRTDSPQNAAATRASGSGANDNTRLRQSNRLRTQNKKAGSSQPAEPTAPVAAQNPS